MFDLVGSGRVGYEEWLESLDLLSVGYLRKESRCERWNEYVFMLITKYLEVDLHFMISEEQVDGMSVDRFSYSEHFQRQTPLDSRITPFYLHETAC